MKKLLSILLILLILPLSLLGGCDTSLKDEISQADWNSNRKYIQLSTGLKMSYVEMGNPNGEAIILQHGMTDNSRAWSLAAPYFAKAGYHVYIPDLRGQGKSEEKDGHYTTFTYATDLNAFFEAKHIDSAIVVGHSLGSLTMQTFWLMYPSRVKKCVLVSSIPMLGYQTTSLTAVYANYVKDLPDDGHVSDGFIDYWYDNSNEPVEAEIQGETFDTFLQYMKAEAQALSKQSWTNIILGMLESNFGATNGGEYNMYSYIDKSKPCLILHGSTDTMAAGAYQEELCSLLRNQNGTNITYHEYTGVGHNIQYVIPKQSANDILTWLSTGTLPN